MFALMRLLGMLVMLWLVIPTWGFLVTEMAPVLSVGESTPAFAQMDEALKSMVSTMMWMMTYVAYAGAVLFVMQAVLELTWEGMIGVGIRDRADQEAIRARAVQAAKSVLPTPAVPTARDLALEAKIQESLEYDQDLQNAERIIGTIEELLHLPRTVPTRETVQQRTMAQFDRVMRRLKDIEDEPSEVDEENRS